MPDLLTRILDFNSAPILQRIGKLVRQLGVRPETHFLVLGRKEADELRNAYFIRTGEVPQSTDEFLVCGYHVLYSRQESLMDFVCGDFREGQKPCKT